MPRGRPAVKVGLLHEFFEVFGAGTVEDILGFFRGRDGSIYRDYLIHLLNSLHDTGQIIIFRCVKTSNKSVRDIYGDLTGKRIYARDWEALAKYLVRKLNLHPDHPAKKRLLAITKRHYPQLYHHLKPHLTNYIVGRG